MSIRRLSPRRCPTTAAILRLKRQLEALGFTISDVGPDGVRVNQPFGSAHVTKVADAPKKPKWY